jgi:hypothetical protein
VTQVDLPKASLLADYAKMKNCHTDCFSVEIDKSVCFEKYAYAFLTSPIFKLERWILKLILLRPSTDQQALRLAQGDSSQFAAWHVKAQNDQQLLMSDFSGKTRFWIMAEQNTESEKTMLYFGSAVLPNKDGIMSKSIWFALMMQFHKLYSSVLLWSAKSKLKRIGS